MKKLSQKIEKLSPSRPGFDHEIKLQEGSEPPWKNIYHMSEKELKILKEELTRLIQLGFIWKSTSPYGSPIFFDEEKEKLRPVIDY